MAQKDHWTDTLRRKEKADEDRYFVEQDRKLIEKLHRQRQPVQPAEPLEAMPQVPIKQAPLAPDSTEPTEP